ncbi:MAG: C-GCAxxG-C-C family protein [Proteobacteria bacterium]|nr:C-GCAxxG-C-C family protein [Pseudomonadota bacterium]
MTKSEVKKDVSTVAIDYFQNGYHCAESIVAAVLGAMGEDSKEAVAHATAFGGGFGRSLGDACGALSGALVAIGHLHGRRKPGDCWNLAANLGAAIRDAFIESYETTHCKTLKERFGEEQQLAECQKLTGELAQKLYDLLIKTQNEQEENK